MDNQTKTFSASKRRLTALKSFYEYTIKEIANHILRALIFSISLILISSAICGVFYLIYLFVKSVIENG